MKTKVLALTIALNVFAVAPLWAQEEKIIERLKAGQSVDPKELDVIFSGRVN